MTGLVFDIKRFAVHDGDGIRTTVFIKGCPLNCKWCHNPEGISFLPQMQYFKNKCINCGECVSICKASAQRMLGDKHVFDRKSCIACGECQKVCLGEAMHLSGREMTAKEVFDAVMEDKVFYDTSSGGVTLSGGECLCNADFCASILKLCKENGIHCAVDTSGFVPKSAIDKVAPYTDIFLYDIKHFDSDKHKKFTYQGNEKILENLIYIDGKGIPFEVRIPLIKGVNDDAIAQIGEFLSGLNNLTKVRLLPYNSIIDSKYEAIGKMSDKENMEVPDSECIERAKKTLEAFGINVVV
jgi:pyruvate formate lyase activating enzyme